MEANQLRIITASILLILSQLNGGMVEVEQSEDCILWGIWSPEFNDLSQLKEFEEVVGERADVVPWYQAWGRENNSDFKYSRVMQVLESGRIPMITWEPWDPDEGVGQTKYSLSSIASGYHDTYIRSWARSVAHVEKPILLRFAHEMNGDWYPWAPKASGESPEVYRTAWVRIVRIFEQEGAENAQFVWSPNRDYHGATSLQSLYPGDEYVDWIGIDGYNFGDNGWSHFRDFDETFQDTYTQVTNFSSLPVMIGEMGSSDLGGSRAEWIRGFDQQHLNEVYPRLRLIVYFNQVGSGDWVLRESDGSLDAFSDVVQGLCD